MSEYIRISEYCELSQLNKSKVYRAINTGLIKTKKIDGVKYINIAQLPVGYEIQEPTIVESQTKIKEVNLPDVSVAEILEKPSVAEVISQGDDQFNLFKTFCDQLEKRTQHVLNVQENSINLLKEELEKKQSELDKVNKILLKTENFDEKQSKISDLESELKQKESIIIDLEKKTIQIFERLNSLEKSFVSGVKTDSQLDVNLEEEDYITVLKTSDPSKAIVIDTNGDEINISQGILKEKQYLIDSLEKELFELKNVISDYENQVGEKQLLINSLEAKIESFVSDSDEKGFIASGTELDQSYFEDNKDIKKLENDLENNLKIITSLEDETYQLKETINLLENDLKEKQLIIDEMGQSPEAHLAMEAERDDYITVLGKSVGSDPYAIKETKTVDTNLEDRIKILESDIENYKKIIEDYEKALDEKQDSINNLENQMIENESGFQPFSEEGYSDNISSENNVDYEKLKEDLIVKNNMISELEKSLSEKQHSVSELETELFSFQQKITNLVVDINKKEERIEQLESALESDNGGYATEETEDKLESETIRMLENDLSEARNMIASYENQIDEKLSVITELEKKIESVYSSTKFDEKPFDDNEIYEKQKKIDELEELVSNLREQVIEFESKSISTGADFDESELSGDKQELFDRIAVLENDLNSSVEKVDNFEKVLKEKTQIIYDLENKLYEKQQQILSLDKFPGKLNDEMKSLENERDLQQRKIRELERELNKFKFEIPNLEKESVDIQLRFSYLMNEIQDYKTTISSLENKLKEKENLLIEHNNIIQERQERINDIQKIADKRKQKIEELENEIKNKSHQLAKFSSIKDEDVHFGEFDEINPQIIQLEKELQEKQVYIMELETKLNFESSYDAEVSGDMNHYKIKIEELEKELKEKSDQLQELESNKVDVKPDSFQKKVEIAIKNSKIEELEKMLKEKNEYISNLEKNKDIEVLYDPESKVDLENKDARIKELEAEINRLKEQKPDPTDHLDDDLIDNLKIELDEKNEIILKLKSKLSAFDDKPEPSQAVLMEEGFELTSFDNFGEMEKITLDLDGPPSFIGDDLQNEPGEKDLLIKNLEEQLHLSQQKINELTGAEGAGIYNAESEKDSQIRNLEKQVESLIEENNIKNKKINELEYGMVSPLSNSSSMDLNDEDASLEIEKLKMATGQAKMVISSKDEELAKLREKLVAMQIELDKKEDELKEERHKAVSIALAKSNGEEVSELSIDSAPISGDKEEEYMNKIKSLAVELDIAVKKQRELEWKNEQLYRKIKDSEIKGGDKDKSGWMNKL